MPSPQSDFGERCWVLIPASGKGSRVGADRPKQYLELKGKTILQHTLDRLLSHPAIYGAVLVLAADDSYWRTLNYQSTKPLLLAPGGRERFHSVSNGLDRLAETDASNPLVLIHDAVRPLVAHADLDRLIDRVRGSIAGGLLATPIADTLKLDHGNGAVEKTRDRSGLWRAFTPQAFYLQAISMALKAAISQGLELTDDASAMENAGYHPALVECNPINLKITHPSDLRLASILLDMDT